MFCFPKWIAKTELKKANAHQEKGMHAVLPPRPPITSSTDAHQIISPHPHSPPALSQRTGGHLRMQKALRDKQAPVLLQTDRRNVLQDNPLLPESWRKTWTGTVPLWTLSSSAGFLG